MDVQDIKGIVLHIVGCLLIFYSGFMFGRATLPDHGNGAGEVRQELDRVEEYQRQAEDRVRDIEKTTGIRKIKSQRNIAYMIAAACLYFAVRKL